MLNFKEIYPGPQTKHRLRELLESFGDGVMSVSGPASTNDVISNAEDHAKPVKCLFCVGYNPGTLDFEQINNHPLFKGAVFLGIKGDY